MMDVQFTCSGRDLVTFYIAEGVRFGCFCGWWCCHCLRKMYHNFIYAV